MLLFLFTSSQVNAASADSFKSQEYWNSTGLDFIHAADAYALGYTGAGITLGIVDTSVRTSHPELAGKIGSVDMPIDDLTGLPYIPNWKYDRHGSHVAGIMAASRNGTGMHGVAFDAKLISAAILGHETGSTTGLTPPDLLSLFGARPDVRVINNSWGLSYAPILEPGMDVPSIIQNLVENDEDLAVDRQLAELATDYNKVIVFAAGNDTFMAPAFQSSLPRYLPDLKAWLSVISLDIGNITTAADGTRTISPTGISWFSNLGHKAQLWSVSAPGSDINSLNATNNGYTLMSGTSMAAPYVSGTLGLVQQAFPWMTGKQLADAVLTTADNSFVAPTHLVQYSLDGNGYIDKVVITIVDNAVPSPTGATVKQWIDDAYPLETWIRDTLKDLIDQGQQSIQYLSREEVFGQGLLDAGKAVRGIARLDANRMTADDVITLSELGGKHALETFDTQGYVAEFSNDITQRMWEDSYHHADFLAGADATALRGLNVGLRKAGDGLLVLSGTNDYSGLTVVEGGALAVSQRADGTGGVLQNSDVLVRQNGILMGDGEIQRSVLNKGTVAPGYRGLILKVNSYTQDADGALHIGITADKQYSVLSATTATLDGALRFSPAPGFYSDGYAISVNSVQAVSSSGMFDSVGMVSSSPTLSFSVASSNGTGSAALGQQRMRNAYSRYADSSTTANVGDALYLAAGSASGDMQNLFQALDWTDVSGSGVAPAMEQLSPNSYDAVARAGLDAQRQLNLLLVKRFLGGSAPVATASGTGLSSGDAAFGGWQAWALPFGSYSNVNANGGSAGFTSSGAGLALGVDRQWDSGLTAGLDVALSGRRTYMHYAGEAKAETLAASVGGHAHFKPLWWDGGYVMGMARVGFEDVNMKRAVNFNGYLRKHDSRWTGLTTDLLAGGGKNWSWTPSWGGVEAGPLGWFEYSLSSRPGFTEGGAGASALKLDAATDDSLSSVLGAHAKLSRTLENGTTLSWDTLAGWRHDWLDGSFHSDASFKGYDASFESQSDIPGRDAMLVQTGLRATHASGFFAQVELGAEFFRSHSSSCSGGISFGLEF
nr:S8 family serine peptidase [Desulfovibrio intestinalis]